MPSFSPSVLLCRAFLESSGLISHSKATRMAYQPSSHFAPASNRRRMGGTGGEWPGKGWGGGVESAIGQQMQAVLGWLAGRPAGQPAARTTNASAAVKKASWRPVSLLELHLHSLR